jgi:16S rRNA (uracil1498-N3)-methyltransferase
VRRRFFVDAFADSSAVMEGEAAHHLGRVLRAQPGQLYELSNGVRVHLARIEKVARDRVEFALLEELPSTQARLEVTLFLSIVKFDMFEWAIEKATELGVSTIVPLAAARSEKALLAAAPKRTERWKKIVLEASQQSRRVRVPLLSEIQKSESAFASSNEGVRVLLSERGEISPMRKVLEGQRTTKAYLAIGPEGGWTDPEFEAARRNGFQEASLGRLILRTETAVIAALASLNYALSAD